MPGPPFDIESTAKLPAPFTGASLVAFGAAIPPEADVTVQAKIKHGGSQRDPVESIEVTGLLARWNGSA